MGKVLSLEDYESFTMCADNGTLILYDTDSFRIKFASKEFCNLIGVSKPVSLFNYMSDSDRLGLLEKYNSGDEKFSFDCDLITKDSVFKSATLKFYRFDNKIYCLVLNCFKREQYLKQLSFEQSRYESLIEMSDLIILELDLYCNITYRTMAFNNLFNLKCSNLEFRTYILSSDFVTPSCMNDIIKALRFDYTSGKSYQTEVELKTVEGYKWFKLAIRGIINNGTLLRIVCRFEDIDLYKRKMHSISTKSFKDEMTGCFKKNYLLEKLSNKVLDTSCFLLFFDVDNFKGINDTFGHINGDVALKEIARNAFKTFGDYESIICRFGGDEYCIFVSGIDVELAEKLIGQFRIGVRSIIIDDKRPVSVSIGVSQGSNCDLSTMMSEADLALYYTKEGGKNSFNFYNNVRDKISVPADK